MDDGRLRALHELEAIRGFYDTGMRTIVVPERDWWTPGVPLDALPTDAELDARWDALASAAAERFGVDAMARFTAVTTGDDAGAAWHDWWYDLFTTLGFWARETMALYLDASGPAGALILRDDAPAGIAHDADAWLRGRSG